ncbi:MAG: OmpA family protein [Cyclobacteriaceae bacterium]
MQHLSLYNPTSQNMRIICFAVTLLLMCESHDLFGQCQYITPPAIKNTYNASREITFSGVTMNGKTTTYLAVEKGESVKITTNIESKKSGDYCPDCIVQIYWGITGHTSVCAKSYYGYQFDRISSTHRFKAPTKDGIYYITMGSTLDYSCKNNVFRPRCATEYAFAVLKVGNPDPEKKVTLSKVEKGSSEFLKTSLLKSGCFGELDKIEWFLDGEKLAYDNQEEIPLAQLGTYKVLWSNCLASVADSINHNSSNKKKTTYTLVPNSKPTVAINPTEVKQAEVFKLASAGQMEAESIVLAEVENSSLEDQIEKNDQFVLTHLIFDLGKSDIKPEAETELDRLAQIMKDKPTMRILLEGHTDQRGSAKRNLVLSEQRVKSAKAYLVRQGVERSNIETKGWGHQKPLIVTKDIEEGKINRRVEMRILSRL